MKFINIDVADIYDKKVTASIEIIKFYVAVRGINTGYKTRHSGGYSGMRRSEE